jgi:hypothetical protein
MHLGAESSLLTNLSSNSLGTNLLHASPVLEWLIDCLRTIVPPNSEEKPTLVLNGDILELDLAADNEAAMAFERFLELIMPAGGGWLFKQLLFIPGNHDHHLWESARELQYSNYIQYNPNQQQSKVLAVPWHATKMDNPFNQHLVGPKNRPVPATFLNAIISRHLPPNQHACVDTVYPNLALFNSNGSRCVIISHGHFIEPAYTLMSTINCMLFSDAVRPTLPWDLEAQNFAWIDFIWSTLGRSADVGRDMELVYDKFQNKKQRDRLLGNLFTGLSKTKGSSNCLGWWKAKLMKILFTLCKCLLPRLVPLEKYRRDAFLGRQAQDGLNEYMQGPVLNQFETEYSRSIPSDVTFVFGHTHKPFQKFMVFNEYPSDVSVYNSGGWVVDTTCVEPLHGGALIVIDEDLNVVSLRMYNEAKDRDKYAVKVQDLTPSGAARSSLCVEMQDLVCPGKSPWSDFSQCVYEERPRRVKNLNYKIRA